MDVFALLTNSVVGLAQNVTALSFIIYGAWLFTGCIFYKFYDGWTSPTSFYYAVEAGLNLGFCSPFEVDDNSRVFTIIYVLVGSSVLSGCLGLFIADFVYAKTPFITPQPLEDENAISLRQRVTLYFHRFLHFIGWYSNKQRVNAVILLILWYAWGTGYAMWAENWSFVTALYFAITSAATAGLQDPTCVDNTSGTDCDMGNNKGSVFGVYFMIAIPLCAYTLAQFSEIIIGNSMEVKDAKVLMSPIKKSEISFVSNLCFSDTRQQRQEEQTPGDGGVPPHPVADESSLSFGEFVLLELLRMSRTNVPQVERLIHKFNTINTHQSLSIDVHTLIVSSIVKDPSSATPRRQGAGEGLHRMSNEELQHSFLGNAFLMDSSLIDINAVKARLRQFHANRGVLYNRSASFFSKEYIFSNIYIISLSLFALWTLVGILFYRYYDQWTWGTAYYYAMDAGMCVGYCGIAELNDGSKAFTIFYVLFGATFIVSCVMATILTLLDRYSVNDSIVPVYYRWDLVSVADSAGAVTASSLGNFFSYQIQYWSGWLTDRPRTILLVIFLGWVAWGTAFVMSVEGWSFITGVYFAVTSMSTGGLINPSCVDGTDDTNCDMGYKGVVIGIFIQIGVPIYAATLGYFTNIATGHALLARERKLLNIPIHLEELAIVFKLLSLRSTSITSLTASEFVVLELLRLEVTNVRQVLAIKEYFILMDADQDGRITIDDMKVYNKFAEDHEATQSSVKRPRWEAQAKDSSMSMENHRASSAIMNVLQSAVRGGRSENRSIDAVELAEH